LAIYLIEVCDRQEKEAYLEAKESQTFQFILSKKDDLEDNIGMGNLVLADYADILCEG